MNLQKIKNNRGFVILFAVTIASIILAVSLGVADIALNEVKFSTSAKDTGDAFFAADTGTEYALFHDKPNPIVGDYATPSAGTSATYPFAIGNLGSTSQSCVEVTVTKDNTNAPNLKTTIVADGYNVGTASGSTCVSSNPNRVERELKTSFGGAAAVTWVYCSAENGTCSFSGTTQVRYGDSLHSLYNYQNATNSIACNNATFGDPDVGTVKECDYAQ